MSVAPARGHGTAEPGAITTGTGTTTAVSDGDLVAALRALREDARALEQACRAAIDAVPEPDRPSARNLVHYVALRNHDIRALQRALAARGLSSLGRAEGHVLATIDAVLGHLGATAAHDAADCPTHTGSVELLERHTCAALGPPPPADRVRLMVTLPGDAATHPTLIPDLIGAGMAIARVNCAHDDPDTWRAMVAAVRAGAARSGREVRVAFDLAGPKLRTGPLPPGPRVVRIRPRRGPDGHVERPGVAWLVAGGEPIGVGTLPVDEALVSGAAVGDEIVLRDARDRRRPLAVSAVEHDAIVVTTQRSVYIAAGTPAQRTRDGRIVANGAIGDLPPTDAPLHLGRGDLLRIRRGAEPGRAALTSPDGVVLEPATVGCDLDAVFEAIAIGHRVLIDDGAIAGTVEHVAGKWFDVVITRPAAAKLRAEKGINLPDTDLVAPALSEADRAALDAVAPLADLVSLSFVRSVDDLTDLRRALAERGRSDVAIGLKIEHAAAFAALPRLLLDGLKGPPIAIMLARGDLAIEVGFERLAEVQEEVLWLCEAAHVPVIWATQVAESLAKQGLPTRAEVTDAAWASRAECVMLNKGPHILDAIRFVDDVVERMHGHQDKRTPLLRRLSVSDAFAPLIEPPGRS